MSEFNSKGSERLTKDFQSILSGSLDILMDYYVVLKETYELAPYHEKVIKHFDELTVIDNFKFLQALLTSFKTAKKICENYNWGDENEMQD